MPHPQPQLDPHLQSPPSPPRSQAPSLKTPTHFTIQQENQNHKTNPKQQSAKPKNHSKLIDDRKFRKLSKQTKKVKSLEDQYRELQQELKQIKQLLQIQLQIIALSTDQVNQINNCNDSTNGSQENSFVNKSTNSETTITIQPLQACLEQLFAYQSAIQTANSNYLLLSQVNKEQQSQQTFHIHNLEERIRQLRFLLNGKQDLLAYEIATFEGADHVEQDTNDVRKIFIDYHLPRRQSLGNRNNMEGQFRFVQKVIAQMLKLKNKVKSLQSELQKNKKGNEYPDQTCSQQLKYKLQKDAIKENDEEYEKGQTLATPTKTARTREPDRIQVFTECQNTLLSAQTTRQTYRSPSSPKRPNHEGQLTLLPLSIQNYKHSLIYRVGKLQNVEHEATLKLQQKYQNLVKTLKQQQNTRKQLIKEYELKRDVFQYKKKLLLNSKKEITSFKKNQNYVGSILQELEHQEQTARQHTLVQVTSKLQNYDDSQAKENEEKYVQAQVIQENPVQDEIMQVQNSTSSKGPSIINLSTSSSKQSQSSKSGPTNVNSQNNVIFHELTNSHTTPNKKLHHSPFLKLKESKSKGKALSQKEDLRSTKTPIKEKTVCGQGDKQNTAQKREFQLRDKEHLVNLSKQEGAEKALHSSMGEEGGRVRGVSPEKRQENGQNRKGKSTLRKRRENAKAEKQKGHGEQIALF